MPPRFVTSVWERQKARTQTQHWSFRWMFKSLEESTTAKTGPGLPHFLTEGVEGAITGGFQVLLLLLPRRHVPRTCPSGTCSEGLKPLTRLFPNLLNTFSNTRGSWEDPHFQRLVQAPVSKFRYQVQEEVGCPSEK